MLPGALRRLKFPFGLELHENCHRHEPISPVGWGFNIGTTLISAPFLRLPDADSPSVLQLRAQDISPQRIGKPVLSAFKQFEEMLNQGALVSIDEKRARDRILPFSRQL